MNIPLQFQCPTCRAPANQRIHLNATSLDFKCAHCGERWYGISSLDVTVGPLMLERSRYELMVESDYDMAIVLSAAALECELSRLFCKWEEIKALSDHRVFSSKDCEVALRKLGNIDDKIKKISETLYPGGIEAFVGSSPAWTETIREGFPSLRFGSLAADFQQTVFWPRNAVLHRGQADHTKKDASRCYSIAHLGLGILKDMDKAKIRAEGL